MALTLSALRFTKDKLDLRSRSAFPSSLVMLRRGALVERRILEVRNLAISASSLVEISDVLVATVLGANERLASLDNKEF